MNSKESIPENQSEPSTDSNNNENTGNKRWHCPICKKSLKSPVVTPCGHIFCWPCISKLLQNEDKTNNSCPICHTPVDINKIVPIYGQTNEAKDSEAPPPPKAERVETEEEIRERNNQNNFPNQGNFNFDFNFFPLGASIGFTIVNGQIRGGNRQGFTNSIFLFLLFFLLPTIFILFASNVM